MRFEGGHSPRTAGGMSPLLGQFRRVMEPDIHIIFIFAKVQRADFVIIPNDAFIIQEADREGFELDRGAHKSQPDFAVHGQREGTFSDEVGADCLSFAIFKETVLGGKGGRNHVGIVASFAEFRVNFYHS